MNTSHHWGKKKQRKRRKKGEGGKKIAIETDTASEQR